MKIEFKIMAYYINNMKCIIKQTLSTTLENAEVINRLINSKKIVIFNIETRWNDKY